MNKILRIELNSIRFLPISVAFVETKWIIKIELFNLKNQDPELFYLYEIFMSGCFGLPVMNSTDGELPQVFVTKVITLGHNLQWGAVGLDRCFTIHFTGKSCMLGLR